MASVFSQRPLERLPASGRASKGNGLRMSLKPFSRKIRACPAVHRPAGYPAWPLHIWHPLRRSPSCLASTWPRQISSPSKFGIPEPEERLSGRGKGWLILFLPKMVFCVWRGREGQGAGDRMEASAKLRPLIAWVAGFKRCSTAYLKTIAPVLPSCYASSSGISA